MKITCYMNRETEMEGIEISTRGSANNDRFIIGPCDNI